MKFSNKLKGKDCPLVINGNIPCAFYSVESEWWWYFEEERQLYVLDQPENVFDVTQNDLSLFDRVGYIPFYRPTHVQRFMQMLSKNGK